MNSLDKLFQAAKDCRNNAYAPYSDFQVGAALLADDNRIYVGCNVENISYPCGTCAEAGAIAAMRAAGAKHIKDIVIVANGQNLITPCGACLQRIKEFSIKETCVHLADLSGIKQSITMDKLLPYAFSDKELKK